jgi:hypothetical protein
MNEVYADCILVIEMLKVVIIHTVMLKLEAARGVSEVSSN